ncbi:MAG: response regulator [Planctomycetota bacterium]
MSDTPRILLLDNDAKIVELVAWFLGSKGYEVRTARSFAELDAALAASGCDLLVSDVDLGTESALVELPRRSAAGTLPRTLVVSGFLDAANQGVLAAVPEVVGTLAKPFEFEALEEAVAAALAPGGAGGAPEGVAAEGPPGARDGHPAPPTADGPGSPPADDDGWIEITPQG